MYTYSADGTRRVFSYQDEDAENPLSWGWNVEVHDIDSYDIIRGCASPSDDLALAACRFNWRFPGEAWKRDRAIHLYMLLCGDERAFQVHEYQGYGQSDWATVLVLAEDHESLGLWDAYERWRKGDVYTVEVQRKTIWTSEYDEVREEWEHEESISGCYLDDDYTDAMVASEYWGFVSEGE